ncbi:MAG: transglutaminase domain-containing protein [Desulfobacteraceae bacterium]|nr:transglutaminase domain-containing protein [Desulfobacteraceae bacterium]
MSTPPFIVGASLLFWGWQKGFIISSVLMAIVLEFSNVMKSKWDITPSDFNRISDLCAVVLAGTAIYILTTTPIRIIFIIIGWLPIIVFPLIVAQKYSIAGRIELKALFSFARRNQGHEKINNSIDLSYPYFALCFISAGSANNRGYLFYTCIIVFLYWSMWSVRSKRFPLVLWVCLIMIAGYCGYIGHNSLNRLQMTIMNITTDFFMKDSDPFKSITAIGEIGELKLSDKILFRVEPDTIKTNKIKTDTVLLREASYNKYNISSWFAKNAYFKPLKPEKDKSSWILGDRILADRISGERELSNRPGENKSITIISSLKRGKSLLKLPTGASKVNNLPVLALKKNSFGAVKVENDSELIKYTVLYDLTKSNDSPPNKDDLKVSGKEKEAIFKIVKELNLSSKKPDNILQTVDAFFNKKFNYSLILDDKGPYREPLSNFLLSSKTGHCEHFASATALILRACGIPARYATGYSVHEFSRLENKIVVRASHAHAWTLAYINGSWRDFDTTPPSWRTIDEKNLSKSYIYDFFSFLTYQFYELRSNKEGLKKYSLWFIVPLVIIISRRLFVRRKIKRVKKDKKESNIKYERIEDSEFYPIEKKFNEMGFDRYPWETYIGWINRINKTGNITISVKDLFRIIDLCNQNRFSFNGLGFDDKKRLDLEVKDIVERL